MKKLPNSRWIEPSQLEGVRRITEQTRTSNVHKLLSNSAIWLIVVVVSLLLACDHWYFYDVVESSRANSDQWKSEYSLNDDQVAAKISSHGLKGLVGIDLEVKNLIEDTLLLTMDHLEVDCQEDKATISNVYLGSTGKKRIDPGETIEIVEGSTVVIRFYISFAHGGPPPQSLSVYLGTVVNRRTGIQTRLGQYSLRQNHEK